MNAVLNRMVSLREFYLSNEKWLVITGAVLLTLLFVLRLNWSSDMVTVPTFILFFLVWVAVFTFKKRGIFSLGLVRTLGLVSLASLATHFVAGSAGELRVAVHVASGQTTISLPVVLHIPFTGDVVFVYSSFNQHVVDIPIGASDNVPLTCSTYVTGIVLDWRDKAKLEQSIVMNNLGEDPSVVINSRLQEAIRAETIAALAGLSSVQVASRDNIFKIPYEIGSPLGDVLVQNNLRWENGNVSLHCEVVFNS